MGVYIDAYAVELPRFAEFLRNTVGELLVRYQLNGRNKAERLQFTDSSNFDTFFADPAGLICVRTEHGGLQEVTEDIIRTSKVLRRPAHEHLSGESIYQASWLLRAFSNCEGIDFIKRLFTDQRRWWIGSVLAAAQSRLVASEYQELEDLFRRWLRGMDCGHPLQNTDPGIVASGLPFVPPDDPDLRFGRWLKDESSTAVTLLSKLKSLSPPFKRPSGPIGLAPADADWNEWITSNIEGLLQVAELRYRECNVLTFIG